MADYHNLDESNKPISISYAGKTFSGETKFKGSTFKGEGGNFKGAVFEGSADFTDAIFEGETVDFTDAVFLAGVLFENAQFGKDYQRAIGEWEIRFSKDKDAYFLETRKSNGTEKEWVKFKVLSETEPNFPTLLKGREIDKYSSLITDAFNTFRANPENVSFEGCRFGAINIEGFSTEQINVINKEGYRINRFQLHRKYRIALSVFSNHNFSSESSLSEVEKTGLMSILARHLETTELDNRCLDSSVSFKQAKFYPQADVSFENSLFLNHEAVDFTFATFSNGRNVNFTSSTFSNGVNVDFTSSTFNNGGKVDFSYATFKVTGVDFSYAKFSNGKHVNFSSAMFSDSGTVIFTSVTFSNGKDVNFSATIFSNGGHVDFDLVAFSNGRNVNFTSSTFNNRGDVSFYSATFSNIGAINLSRIIWINDGSLNLSIKEYRETLPVKFDKCLFLSAGEISFKEARSPEKGSLMFQGCYFGRTKKVDFTGVFFRHTSFEGGEFSWLKDSPEQTPKDRLKEKYDSLLDKTKNQLESGENLVFEEGVEVLWKDLTTESAKNLTLRRVNLSHSIFDGMTLSHIQLNAPEWFKDQDGRKILYEEIKLRETAIREKKDISKFDLKNIEDQYTQLKNNLEKQGNYLNAGYFHYGEQEVRREIAKKEGRTFKYRLTGCYKYFSGYGEMPDLAFKRALQMLVGFAVFLVFLNIIAYQQVLNDAGFCSSVGKGLAKVSNEYDNLGLWGFCVKFLARIFSACVEILTPFSWKGSKSLLETFSEIKGLKLARMFFLVFSQFMVLAIQVPLLLMAVGRLFKR